MYLFIYLYIAVIAKLEVGLLLTLHLASCVSLLYVYLYVVMSVALKECVFALLCVPRGGWPRF